MPERADAVTVTMLMALTSAQLLVTGMTPYAMTGHFALNMLWLALVLRGDRLGHMAAGLTVLDPRWAASISLSVRVPDAVPAVVRPATPLGRCWLSTRRMIALAVAIWAKLWPQLMIDWYGPPADVRPSAGVGDKMSSLADRLDEWRPLLYMSRFFAWNNLLLVPLALDRPVAHGLARGLAWRADRAAAGAGRARHGGARDLARLWLGLSLPPRLYR
jgi:hypothetical protein